MSVKLTDCGGNKVIKTFFSIFCIIVPALYFGIKGKPTEMGIAVIAGAIAACFINLDKFKSIKGAGFEAQLRETKETIDKAIITVEKLKEIIAPMILNTLHSITYMGRYSAGGPTSQKDKIRDYCSEIKKGLGIDNDEIEAAVKQYNTYSLWDAFSNIEHSVSYSECLGKTIIANINNALSQPNMYKDDKLPSVEFIERIFIENGIISDKIPVEIKKAFDNYSYRVKNNASLFEDDF